MKFLLMLVILVSSCAVDVRAATTWIPIAVGDISTVIPYTPTELFSAPSNVNVAKTSSGLTLSWNDVEHASKFQVQALNAQGKWVTIATTAGLSLTLTGNNANYNSFRIVACNYNSCAGTGKWSSFGTNSSITYTYDARGRLIEVTSSSDQTTSYSYDDAGNRKEAGKEN